MWKSGSTETTTIGYVNRNNQKVIGHRDIQGTDHRQFSYKLNCLVDGCGCEYGANGTDIFQRKCPQCQGGEPSIEYEHITRPMHTDSLSRCAPSLSGDWRRSVINQEKVMRDFIAIDFETANPKRVSACAVGYAKVSNGEIVESNGYLIKPVGGHAPFQSKIHGIKEEHTCDKPEFGELFPGIQDIFSYPLVAHSLFDKQVLYALADHFNLSLDVEYYDSSSLAKEYLPDLKNHKLKTLVKHFQLPTFKHHDATEDAIACARIFLRLQDLSETNQASLGDERFEFKGLIEGILADDEVNYKEAYQLLYWLEDHTDIANEHIHLFMATQEFLEDDYLDDDEAMRLKKMLKATLRDINN